MTTLAFRNQGGLFDGLDISSAGKEGERLQKNLRTEIERLRLTGARSSGALQDLELLAREYGTTVQWSRIFKLGQRFLLVLPTDLPSPDLDVDNDGDIRFEWYGSGSRIISIALRENGKLSYAARLSTTKTRNGNDYFVGSIPQEILGLVRAVTAHQ
jgi:hypothetical protein